MIELSNILQSKILIVDDQQVNILLLKQMLQSAGYISITSTTDPKEVAGLQTANHYDLILLDLQMPVMDGFEVMEELKKIEPDQYLSVLVVTAQPGHKLRALNTGAKDFVSKPFELPEILARVHNLLEVRLLHNQLQNYNDSLEEQVRERTNELQESYLETIFTMTRAVEHKDKDIGDHVKRISYYCRDLAQNLGMDAEFVDKIFFASPMHDVGKIGIPDYILLKSSSLNPDEWQIMKSHTTIGSRILGESKSAYLKMGAEIALSHHECWDGSGYPNGLRGEEIPFSARIMSICDVYDALRSKRPYKRAFSHVETKNIIEVGDGRTKPIHFDPMILAAFKKNQQIFADIFESYNS
jgi:putative two-component system response regulator